MVFHRILNNSGNPLDLDMSLKGLFFMPENRRDVYEKDQVTKRQIGGSSMAELGRQTPTRSVVLPYEKTKGAQAVKLYNLTGRKAQEWQELMLYDIMSVGEDGLWTHVKFGYSLPRRNSKSEILIMRELWGLVTGEHIPIKGTCHAHGAPHDGDAWCLGEGVGRLF